MTDSLLLNDKSTELTSDIVEKAKNKLKSTILTISTYFPKSADS